MRHLKAGRKLGRNATHRLAMYRNMTQALIQHERIITTVEKAKEARRFVEKLITLAKQETLHARRLVAARLGPVANAQILDEDEEPTGTSVLQKLFGEIAPRFQDRPGGYTRIIKRHQRRLGDAGHTAFLELLKADEKKVRKTRAPAPAPAPKVTEPKPESTPPTSETPKPEAAAPEQQPAAEAPKTDTPD